MPPLLPKLQAPMLLAVLLGALPAAAAMPIADLGAAATGCGLPVQNVDFIDQRRAVQELHLPLQAFAASPRLERVGDSGWCGSSRVSDQGTLLTATHCIQTCLRDAGAYAESNGVFEVDQDRLRRGVRCTLVIDGRRRDYAIAAARDCIQKDADGKAFQRNGDLCRNVVEFSLLQPLKPQRGGSCFEQEAAPPQLGSRTAVVGYPGQTFRHTRPGQETQSGDSDGKSVYLSLGDVVHRDTCDRRKGDAHWKDPIQGGAPESKTQLQLEADSQNHSSGGPVFNDQGRQIGVIVAGYAKNSPTYECAGSTFAAPTHLILEAVRSDLARRSSLQGSVARPSADAFVPRQNKDLLDPEAAAAAARPADSYFDCRKGAVRTTGPLPERGI